MNNNRLKIIAKNNVKESYLMAYEHKEDVGFIADFESGTVTPDGSIHTLRKEGIWVDFECSENIERRILDKVASLKKSSPKESIQEDFN